jgi:hypothetical protein
MIKRQILMIVTEVIFVSFCILSLDSTKDINKVFYWIMVTLIIILGLMP